MSQEVQGGKGYPDRGKCMCKGNEIENCQELGFLKTWVHTRKWAGGVTQCLINNAGNQIAGSIAHKDIQGGGLSLEMKSQTELLILPSPRLPHLRQWQLLFPFLKPKSLESSLTSHSPWSGNPVGLAFKLCPESNQFSLPPLTPYSSKSPLFFCLD